MNTNGDAIGFSTKGTPRTVGAEAVSPDQAFHLLEAGNKRFREWYLAHKNQLGERRTGSSQGHHPVAQVLACSDLYVSPEVIFDQGLGDLVITQVLGNVIDKSVRGTLEYGVGLLRIPLIIVLGHRDCGAMIAELGRQEVAGQVRDVVEAIGTDVTATRSASRDRVSDAVRANVIHSVDLLRDCRPTLHSMLESGGIRIVGAIYDHETGIVDWLEH